MLASALHLKRGAEATDDIRTRASEAASLGHGAAGSDSEWRTQVGWSASVRTGQGLFGSARTLEFDALVKARGQAGEEALADEIRDFWKGAFFGQPGDSRERAEAATRVTSERYHLLYYVGKQGILNRVVPELAAKHRDK